MAYDNEEAEIGLRCVASPIRSDKGSIFAGLSISAPKGRHKQHWAAQIKNTTEEITHALGYR